MSHMSKPVDWEIFNIPPVKPVQYYSLLKKKRDFSQLTKQYNTQVLKNGYLHYCGIVPKNINSSFNNGYEIVIVFFDEVPNNSFIGFRVKANNKTFTYESNALLLFLKKSKKAIYYLMTNNCIHVQCSTNAWELFYLLYDDYLRKSVLTIIGTQFFYHFAYFLCIRSEKQLIESLYKGSKIIRISKNSIYYKMHRKRKISITDLIHMTINMPKSKRFIISCFSPKESLVCSDFEDKDFYTSIGNKINVSKLIFKSVKNPFETHRANSVILKDIPVVSDSEMTKFETCKFDKKHNYMKRKFTEFEGNKQNIEFGHSACKFSKTDEFNSFGNFPENEWKQYRDLKPFAINCFSSIPPVSNLVPHLLKNGKVSDFVNSDFYLMNTNCNISVPSLIELNEPKYVIPLTTESSMKTDLGDSFNSNKVEHDKSTEVITKHTILVNSKTPSKIKTHIGRNDSSAKKSTDLQILSDNHKESSHLDDCHKIFSTTTTTMKASNISNQNYIAHENDGGFTSAAGKAINISDTAMLAAKEIMHDVFNCEKQEVVQEKCIHNPKTPNFKMNFPESKKKAITKIPYANPLHKPTFGVKMNRNENFKQDCFNILEDASFTTAAGKAIQVSNNAMQTAHRLIQNVFNEENSISDKCNSIDESKASKNANTFSDSSIMPLNEIAEIDMDKTVIEKLFEERFFDEKELELVTECSTNKNLENSNVAILSKVDKNLPSRKPRKSLGGRRSIRYCSSKL